MQCTIVSFSFLCIVFLERIKPSFFFQKKIYQNIKFEAGGINQQHLLQQNQVPKVLLFLGIYFSLCLFYLLMPGKTQKHIYTTVQWKLKYIIDSKCKEEKAQIFLSSLKISFTHFKILNPSLVEAITSLLNVFLNLKKKEERKYLHLDTDRMESRPRLPRQLKVNNNGVRARSLGTISPSRAHHRTTHDGKHQQPECENVCSCPFRLFFFFLVRNLTSHEIYTRNRH